MKTFKQFLLEQDKAEPKLRQLVAQDQRERNELNRYYQNPKYKGNWQAALQQFKVDKGITGDVVFTVFTPQLRDLCSQINFKKLSKRGWEDFWMLAQHADDDRQLQKWCLQTISTHLGQQSSHYKYLADRISCAETGRQKFNTQDGCNKE